MDTSYSLCLVPISSGRYFSFIFEAASLGSCKEPTQSLGQTTISSWMDNDDFLVVLGSVEQNFIHAYDVAWKLAIVRNYGICQTPQLTASGKCLPPSSWGGKRSDCFLFSFMNEAPSVDVVHQQQQQQTKSVSRTMAFPVQPSTVRFGSYSAVWYIIKVWLSEYLWRLHDLAHLGASVAFVLYEENSLELGT